MSDDIDAQMLSALELLHYSQRFRHRLFAFSFESSAHCEEMLIDLRVLHAAGIRQVLFCVADPQLVDKFQLWNRSGYRFLVLEAHPDELRTASFIGRLQRELGEGSQPLVALRQPPVDEASWLGVQASIMHCAVALGARKVFFPGEQPGLELRGKLRSYPTEEELEKALAEGLETNLSAARLQFIVEQQRLHSVDMVLIQARRGSVFREVFTHSGAGTLLTQEYPNQLRQACETDVRDICAMMQPYVREGLLKPVSEEDILRLIPAFSVYSVNHQIVAAAALTAYDDCYELGKLCTLPRFQARGRARDLVLSLLEKARTEGKRGVFALTVQHYVGDFFERLGFTQVDRETLPESWKKSYDFTRPSKAYWFPLHP